MHLKSYTNLIKLRSGVYRGLDETDNSILIKSFEFNNGQSWGFQRQLEQETAILKSLSYHKIPKYLDSWKDDNVFYLVREYIEGNFLVTSKVFTQEKVINIALQLLDILIYLESCNVTHHDIKPQNIIIDSEENIYLIDFGISRKLSDKTLSITTQFTGTEGFIAPEKILLHRADNRSDLYSLGMVLACMITNTKASEAVNLLNDDFELHSNIRTSGYSPELIEWIIKLTKRKPIDRYKSASIAKTCLVNKKIQRVNKPLFNYNSAYLKGKLIKCGQETFFQDLEAKEYYLISERNLEWEMYETNIYTKTVTQLTEFLSYGNKKITKAVSQIKREYSYHEIFTQAQEMHTKVFATALWQKLNQPKFTDDDLIWLTSYGQAISRWERGYVLWKIYLNPSLLQTLPITILIDYDDLDKRVWTVPPNIIFLEDALAWRSGKLSKNILIRTYKRIFQRKIDGYYY